MPAVFNSFFAQVRPGGIERAIDLSRRVAKPLERSGAKNVRLFRSASGETYGSILFLMEYGSMKDYGVSYDKIMKDEEVINIIAAADGADSPFTSQSMALSNEIPIGTTPKRGPVLQTVMSRPLPGRLMDAIALGTRAGAALKALGTEGRLVQIGPGGMQSGSLVFSAEYPNMAALGEASDKLTNSAEGQALLSEVYSASSPITMVSQDIFTEVTL